MSILDEPKLTEKDKPVFGLRDGQIRIHIYTDYQTCERYTLLCKCGHDKFDRKQDGLTIRCSKCESVLGVRHDSFGEGPLH